MKYLRYRSYSKSFIGIANIEDLLRMNEIIVENKDMSKCIMVTSKDDCFKLLKKHLKERCSVEKKVKKVFKHSKRVLDICEEIISYLDLKKRLRRMTYRAAIFHDIAKFDGTAIPHNENAKAILEKFFNKDDKDFKKICQIIKYHRDEFEPDEDIALLAAILRLADKIDKLNKKQDDAEEIYKENLEMIEEYFKDNEIKHFKKLKKACEIVKEDIMEDIKNHSFDDLY